MFKVGDVVLNHKNQQVRIICTDKTPSEFPIVGLVTEPGHEALVVYTKEGHVYVGQDSDGRDLVQPFDWGKVEVDTRVWMRESKTEGWKAGHFFGVVRGKPHVFDHGTTSHSTLGGVTCWEYTTTHRPKDNHV